MTHPPKKTSSHSNSDSSTAARPNEQRYPQWTFLLSCWCHSKFDATEMNVTALLVIGVRGNMQKARTAQKALLSICYCKGVQTLTNHSLHSHHIASWCGYTFEEVSVSCVLAKVVVLYIHFKTDADTEHWAKRDNSNYAVLEIKSLVDTVHQYIWLSLCAIFVQNWLVCSVQWMSDLSLTVLWHIEESL